VLLALNIPKEVAMGTIRLSTGIHTTELEIKESVEHISKKMNKIL
jgi:cysteine sulfinate desulfinase/cysteine desulfurase-like protein